MYSTGGWTRSFQDIIQLSYSLIQIMDNIFSYEIYSADYDLENPVRFGFRLPMRMLSSVRLAVFMEHLGTEISWLLPQISRMRSLSGCAD